MSFTSIDALPALPADGATGDDFNDPMLTFLTALSTLRSQINTLSGEYAAFVASALTATSSSSVAIGTGSKVFTVGTGYAFANGQNVRVASDADPSTDFMDGVVTDYSGGDLTITVASGDEHGSGTHTDWSIGPILIGYQGVQIGSAETTYTLVLSDEDRVIPLSSGGLTIPANASVAFPVGTTIGIRSLSASTQTISITSDTLTQTITNSTGSRTLLAYGYAVIIKRTSTVWDIMGDVT